MGKRVSNEIEESLQGVMVTLTLNELLIDESENMRRFPYSAAEVEELANSIKEYGLQQNLVATKITEQNGAGFTHKLRIGFQRARALKLLEGQGVTFPIPVKVVEAEELGCKLANLNENMKRKNLSPIDLGYAIKQLVEGSKDAEGKPVGDALPMKEVAARLGMKSAGRSYELVKLVDLRPEIQKRIHNGEIPWKMARLLPTMTEEEQDKALERMAKASSPTAAAEAVQEEMQKRKGGGQGKRKKRSAKVAGGESARLSTKAALNIIEELVTVPEGEKLNKAETVRVDVLKLVAKMLNGRLGAQAFANQLLKAIGG